MGGAWLQIIMGGACRLQLGLVERQMGGACWLEMGGACWLEIGGESGMSSFGLPTNVQLLSLQLQSFL